MAVRKIYDIPMNRVEGDLEIRIEVEDGVVTDAWCAGTLFRGFENLLVGRGALDGLVVTPRICGICSTTHLTAAVLALDMAFGVTPPDNAMKLRNIALMAEHIQSDVRHSVLMFMVDFASPAYASHSLYDEAVRRYTPFAGTSVIDTIKVTKKVLETNAIIGGQWPHSSFMVPGGVTFCPDTSSLSKARHLLRGYRDWYEMKVLGCSLERWAEVRSADDLDAWLEESAAHRDGEVGFFIRFAREAGLGAMGRGCGNFLSYGGLNMPKETRVVAGDGGTQLVPAGFALGSEIGTFDHLKIAEHVAHSWYNFYEGGRHPSEGETNPIVPVADDGRYSWAKAPRYDGQPAETGPLAEAMIGKIPLFVDLVTKEGPSVFSRCLARLTRPSALMADMDMWINEVAHSVDDKFYENPGVLTDGKGFGLLQAARGALGHWVEIKNGKIAHYQIITPTAWHASPRDANGGLGTWEMALIGTRVDDPENPLNPGHVIRSHDACLVCSVHATSRGRTLGKLRMAI